MKTCNFWTGLSIAHDDVDVTRARARTFLSAHGGRFNYLWLFQNQRVGIETDVSLKVIRAAAFRQRKAEGREPNWNRIQALRRLYESRKSKCSEPYIPNVQIAGGFIQFQPLVVRHDLDSDFYYLVMTQARRTSVDLKSVLPMAIYCARTLLLTDAREQLLPKTDEELIKIEVPDLGSDNPKDLRFLRDAHIYSEDDVLLMDSALARQRLRNFEEVWPQEVERHLEQEAEHRRKQRRRNDPWPPGSLFDPNR
ncbi:hypothetical protein [Reyranella sp.]|uniref:hypothetical protein n=1 Tax=Reyranella sp. TaxID=1929291 RepID=UPI003BA9B0F6